MTGQEFLIKQFEAGVPMIVKPTLAVPEDKLDWKPADGSRTIRQVFTEAVLMPAYMAQVLNNRALPPYDELAATYATMSIQELADQLSKNAKTLAEAIKAFPESDYEENMEMPWGTWTYFETMTYPYWNMMWHAGQISYVQTMYGDQKFY